MERWLARKWKEWGSVLKLKELCCNILSHFFDGLNCSWSPGKPKNNALLRKKHIRVDSKAKRKKDGWGWRRWKRIANDDFKKFSQFFQNTQMMTYAVAPLNLPRKSTFKSSRGVESTTFNSHIQVGCSNHWAMGDLWQARLCILKLLKNVTHVLLIAKVVNTVKVM